MTSARNWPGCVANSVPLPPKIDEMRKESCVIVQSKLAQCHARLWSPDPAVLRGVVIFVHGLGDHGGRFDQFAKRMVDTGWAVYAMDLPGHGKTPGRRGIASSYDGLLQLIAAARETLHDTLPQIPQVLVGHSMGGNLAVNYAIRHREFEPLSMPSLAGLTLVAPILLPPQPMDRSKVFAAWGTGQLLRWIRISKPAQVEQLTGDLAMAERIKSDPLQHSQISLYLATQLLAQGRFALDHAAKLQIPTLVMYGEDDELIDKAACKNLALRIQASDPVSIHPRSELSRWPGGRHDLVNDVDADRVRDKLVGWMNRRCVAPLRVVSKAA